MSGGGDPGVQPALSAEEWAKRQAVRGHAVAMVAFGETLAAGRGQDVQDVEEARHAVAALALYGQPFGFTREDVETLEDEATLRGFGAMDDEAKGRDASAGIWRAKQAKLHNLAARIAALLPPEEG